jgi:hypothetical protein
MKVQGISHQQMVELQRAAMVKTNQEHRHQQMVEENNRLRRLNDIRMQELRTARNRRLGNTKGQNVDIDC